MEDLVHKNRSYTVAFKLEVIAYAEDTSNRRASRFYNVDRKRVQEWRKQKTELETVKNKGQARVLEGRGRKAMYPALEKELLDYIKKKREEKIAVTTFMIRRKAKELGEALDIDGMDMDDDIDDDIDDNMVNDEFSVNENGVKKNKKVEFEVEKYNLEELDLKKESRKDKAMDKEDLDKSNQEILVDEDIERNKEAKNKLKALLTGGTLN
ncbi:4165_t:CDS:2 [Gigaspora rosea]|nr:4165_t:CDS:2 [Gigaspora rosea]